MYYTLYAYENSSASTARSLFAHATGLSRNHAESLHEFYSDMERIILTESFPTMAVLSSVEI